MINSGKNVKEISETFDIGENVLYRWKTDQNMKTERNAARTKSSEEQSNFTLRLIAENEVLKKENNRLQTERDILKKASAGVPVTLSSMSICINENLKTNSPFPS